MIILTLAFAAFILDIKISSIIQHNKKWMKDMGSHSNINKGYP